MDNTKHTPAPWVVGPFTGQMNPTKPWQTWPQMAVRCGSKDPRIGAGNVFVTIHAGGVGALSCNKEAIQANARLIAAAPEMYDCLQGLIDEIERCGVKVSAELELLANQAIARVEGEL